MRYQVRANTKYLKLKCLDCSWRNDGTLYLPGLQRIFPGGGYPLHMLRRSSGVLELPDYPVQAATRLMAHQTNHKARWHRTILEWDDRYLSLYFLVRGDGSYLLLNTQLSPEGRWNTWRSGEFDQHYIFDQIPLPGQPTYESIYDLAEEILRWGDACWRVAYRWLLETWARKHFGIRRTRPLDEVHRRWAVIAMVKYLDQSYYHLNRPISLNPYTNPHMVFNQPSNPELGSRLPEDFIAGLESLLDLPPGAAREQLRLAHLVTGS